MTLDIEGRDKKGPIRLRLAIDNQFAGEGEWLRGNLHCHIGLMGDPADVCAYYRDRGFQFLASINYTQITPRPESTRDLITLPGAKMVGSGSGSPHIVCYGLKEDLLPPRSDVPEDTERLVRDAEAQGGLAHLAHPHWHDFSWEA